MNSYDNEKNAMDSKRKMKKSKKEKRSKKHKSKEKKKRMSSSESDSGSDEMEWVEVTSKTEKPKKQREEWMSEETFVPTLSKEEMLANDSSYRRKASKSQEQDMYKPGHHERELNPYWKNDGKGVPEDSSLEIKLSSSTVGDGGLSWLKKAYKRIEEQAEEEGKTMEEIAVERWGSLDKLKSLIAEAEGKMRPKSHHTDRHKDRYLDRSDRKRDYSSEWKRDSCHRKREPSTEARYQQKHHAESTYDKNMFKRPSQESSEDNQETRHSSQGSHEPAWKKKRPLTDNPKNKELAYDKNMFKRPSHESMEEKQESCYSRRSSHQPAWMKKKPPQELLISDKITTGEFCLKGDDSFNSKMNSPQEAPPTKVPSTEAMSMTDNEMNNLAAKILKAEMRGDTGLAAQLQSKLDAAREARKSGLAAKSDITEQKRGEEVVLTKVDSHGIARPLVAPDYPISSSKKKGHSYDKMSKVKSYFSEESEHSLKKMFEREKLTTADDQLEMFVDAAVETRGLTDQDYEIGDISAKVAKKLGQRRQDERDYSRAIQEHKRLNTALEKCEYCFEKMKKHLIIADSQQVYLCLPSYQSLTEDHCLIVPKAHVSTSLLLDEDVAEEMKNFKKVLVRMFKKNNKCVSFMETSTNLKHCPHLVIECCPMPSDMGDIAPMYFKKAIQEQGSEWANNVKLIDLSKKDLKYSVPKGLPFFAVEFSQGGGFAHVVEERDFPRHFGKEIIGGMLEIDSHLCARYRKEDFKDQAKKVLEFTNKWKSYTNEMNIVL